MTQKTQIVVSNGSAVIHVSVRMTLLRWTAWMQRELPIMCPVNDEDID